MKTRRSSLVVLGCLVCMLSLAAAPTASAAIYVKIPNVQGDVRVRGYDSGEWFQVSSLGFAVERDDSQSAAKAGTSDLSISVGMLRPVALEKSLDTVSASLARLAITGHTVASIEIHVVEMDRDGVPVPIQVIRLGQAFVRDWSTSASADFRPTEALTLDYAQFALQTRAPDGRKSPVASWDRLKNTEWTSAGELIGGK